MDKRIKKIADHYGEKVEEEKCMEELNELLDAIGLDLPNLDEELADALITICEFIYLNGLGDKVKFMVDAKLNRQLERMKEEK